MTISKIVRPEPGEDHAGPAPRSRRALLAAGLGGLGAAIAASLGRPHSASAAAGSSLIVGSEINNAGAANTSLATNSTVVAFRLLQNGPGTALMGYVTPTTGTTRGVYGRTDSPNGDGVQARNAGAAGTGAAIRAFGGANTGVEATTDGGGRTAVRGVHGIAGTGIYGGSNGGIGLHGESTSPVIGTGVKGSSTGGNGVHGDSYSGTGVRASSLFGSGLSASSSTAYGVYGTSATGIGIYGFSSDTAILGSSSGGVGVYGYTANPDASSAGFFEGPLNATVKNFRIDHPLDPAEKVLMHSCVESNERLTVYAGTVTTDARGEAVVELPDYFDALNGDVRYQLTPLDDARTWVQQKISGLRFTIATSEPATEVCWQVTGVRRDAFAKAHPLVVETRKAGAERGRYLNPLEHGQPESKGVGFAMRQADTPPGS